MKKYLILLVGLMLTFLVAFSQEERAFHFTPDTTYLPDGSGVSYTTTIDVYGYVAGQTLNSLNEFLGVCVNMEHSFLGDLVISLTCPNNTTVILENQGGSGTFLGIPIDDEGGEPGVGFDYCWTQYPDFGVMNIEAGAYSTLPAGTYASEEPLSNFIGCPLNGPWTIEVTDNWAADDGYIFNWGINFTANPGCFTMLTGRVFADINENNIYDAGDVPLPGIGMQADPGPYYGITDNNGMYRIWVDSANYTVTQIEVNAPWEQSFPSDPFHHYVEVPTNDYDTIASLDFANTASSYCPDLSVDAVLNGLAICSNSSIYIHYENNGTLPTDNTIISVELDENLTYEYGGNLIAQDGNVLSFDVGTVGIGQSGQFIIHAIYSCDIDLIGTTVCIGAHIYPDDPCDPIDEEWDRSSVMVEGECVEDIDVCFTITNTGDPEEGDMQGTSQYRIYEDNVLVHSADFQITGGEELLVCWPANGSTIRLEADQRPGHPGNSHPQESVELCGSPNTTMGQITVVSPDDLDDFVEIDCQEVLASFDPNDKAVIPQGLEEEHYIRPNDVLEYKIRFQNTGTAPAEKVVITDTISDFLDVSTFNHMSSSHTCTVDILYSNIIRWTFEGIMLPDSTHNEPESHGYVKFKINQKAGNVYHDLITNGAAIYFDYNLPVITNQVFTTVGKMETVITSAPIIYDIENKINVYPNPSNSFINFEVNSDSYNIEVYNLSGQRMRKVIGISSSKYTMQRDNLANGIYFYQILDKNGIIASGKLIISD